MNNSSGQVSSFESRLNKVVAVQDDLWEVRNLPSNICQKHPIRRCVLPFRPVTALTEFSDQDITKLRRDVKIAFEDMTSQMNRYNSNHI